MRLDDELSDEPGGISSDGRSAVRSGRDARTCDRCGVFAPAGANFCPECGAPRAADLLDPLAVSARTDAAAGISPRDGSRISILLGLLALTGLVAVLWVITRTVADDGADPGPDEAGLSEGGSDAAPAGPPTEPSAEASTGPATTTTVRVTTTTVDEPLAFYLGEVPGPVLDEGVSGTLVGFAWRRMARIDLATGLVELVELEKRVEFDDPGRGVLLGTELVTAYGSSAIVTDVITGEQRPLFDQPPSDLDDWSHFVGPATGDSVWLGADPGAHEVDLSGDVRRSVEIPDPFWVHRAEGDILYLISPSGTWRYDTVTGEAHSLGGGGWFDSAPRSSRVICDSTLTCRLVVDTPAGDVEVPGVASEEGFDANVMASPDGTEALLQTHDDGSGGPQPAHLDLLDGTRTDLGVLDAELWAGVVWIPESQWVVVQAAPIRPAWRAVHTRSGTVVDIDPAANADVGTFRASGQLIALRYLPPEPV